MAHIPFRFRLATACVLIVSLATSFTHSPASAQAGETWRVADSVIIDTVGYAPALSPDGNWVAGLKDLDNRQLCVWKVSTGEERCNEESSRVADLSIAWSPDSRQVAFSQNGHELDSDIFVLDVRSNSLTNLTEDNVDDLKAAATASLFVIYDRWPVWSADGEEILFIRILNPRAENGQHQIAVSRVIVDTGQVLRGPEMATDEPLELVAEAIGVVTPPVWLADGTAVFAIRGGSDITGVYQVAMPSGPIERIATDPEIPASKTPLVTGLAANDDRISLYWLWEDIAIDDTFQTWGEIETDTGDLVPLEVEAPSGMIVAAPPRLSPDGSAIIYGITADEQTHKDSTIVIQDRETGDTVEIARGVDLQLWESIGGIDWTAANQLVVPLDDGSFEVITLE